MGVKNSRCHIGSKPKETRVSMRDVLSKGSEVLGEACVLEGGGLGRLFFCEVWGEVFAEDFGLVLPGHSEQEFKTAKAADHTFHGSAQQNWRKFRGKLHDEVPQGDPPPRISRQLYVREVRAHVSAL